MNLEVISRLNKTISQYETGPTHVKIGDYTITRSQAIVLVALATGLGEKQVASLLKRSIKTIRDHSQAIKYRIRVKSNIGITHFAIKHGLINAGDYLI